MTYADMEEMASEVMTAFDNGPRHWAEDQLEILWKAANEINTKESYGLYNAVVSEC